MKNNLAYRPLYYLVLKVQKGTKFSRICPKSAEMDVLSLPVDLDLYIDSTKFSKAGYPGVCVHTAVPLEVLNLVYTSSYAAQHANGPADAVHMTKLGNRVVSGAMAEKVKLKSP